MQQAWQNIYAKSRDCGLPYRISITGGEPTVNKNLLPFIEWLRSNYRDVAMVLLTTNGSASLKYYEKICALVEAISFSTHSEHIDEQEFFSKVELLDKIMTRPKKSLHVNIMNEPWNQARIKIYQEWLNQRGISNSVNDIDFNSRIRDYPNMHGNLNLEV
jgi:molybdenum cofactor biosynthesis enzyme MoaA